MLLSAAIDMFLSHCTDEKALCDKTVKAYGVDLRQFREFCARTSRIQRLEILNKSMILGFLKHAGTVYKPKTVTRKYATIRAFFRFLEYEDIIEASPARKIRFRVRDGDTIPRDIPQDDLTRLLSHMYRMVNSTRVGSWEHFTCLRDTAIIEVLFATGIRVSELSHLAPHNVDLHQHIIRVLGKGHRERTVPLCCEQVAHAIAAYDAAIPASTHSRDWFFINRLGNRLTEQSVRNLIGKHCAASGIHRHITPHMFRHSCATQLLRCGMDIRGIQGILGHSSISTTQIYTHLSTLAQRKSIEKFHPRRAMAIGQ